MAEETDEQGAPSEVSFILDALKTAYDQEFQVAERLSAKSRQVFALAAGYFTIVQTVSFSSFLDEEVKAYELWVLLGGVAAGATALAMAARWAARADGPLPGHTFPLWLPIPIINAIYKGSAELPSRNLRVDPENFLGNLPAHDGALKRFQRRFFPPIELPSNEDLARAVATHQVEDEEVDRPSVVTRERAPGVLATFYISLTRSRRRGNESRRRLYQRARSWAVVTVSISTLELLWALIARLIG
jgi:hypothetical protein